MQIENIKHHLDAIDTLSEAQFELWGPCVEVKLEGDTLVEMVAIAAK